MIDRVRARHFGRCRDFRLNACSCINACTRSGLDDHLQFVPDGNICRVAKSTVDDDEKAIPPFSDVAFKWDTVRAPDHEPAVTASFQSKRFARPRRFRIERNMNNGNAFVTFDQFRFKLHLVHAAFILSQDNARLFGLTPVLIYD